MRTSRRSTPRRRTAARAQFLGRAELWLTRAALYTEKAALFPAAVFVVGADTAERVLQPRFYGGERQMHQAVAAVGAAGSRFLVAARPLPSGLLTLGGLAGAACAARGIRRAAGRPVLPGPFIHTDPGRAGGAEARFRSRLDGIPRTFSAGEDYATGSSPVAEGTHVAMAEGRIVDTGKVKAYRPPGQRRQWRLVLLVGALVVGLAVAAYLVLGPRQELYSLRSYNSQEVTRGRLVQTTQASGAVVFPVQMTLVSPEAGSAATLYVQEGDSVQEGQLLAELAATDLEDTLEDLRGDLADAQRSLAKQRLQSRINLERKQRQIDDLAQDITDATAERDEVKSMVAAEVSPPSDLEAAERTLQGLIARP